MPSWSSLRQALYNQNMGYLNTLAFPGCNFTGPIGNLSYYFPHLVALDLSSNQFSGEIPPDVGAGGYKLLALNLSNNALEGE
jgi:hypothetical protein